MEIDGRMVNKQVSFERWIGDNLNETRDGVGSKYYFDPTSGS